MSSENELALYKGGQGYHDQKHSTTVSTSSEALPGASLMTMPPEIIGLIVDYILRAGTDRHLDCAYRPSVVTSEPKQKGREGLIQVNSFFRAEVYAAVRRANMWIRNICFDEGDDGNESLMTRINTWISPSNSDVTCLIFDALVRIPSFTHPETRVHTTT